LTRPFDKHLDSNELDRLLSLKVTSVSDSGQLPEQSLREAGRHVESCQDCSRKLQMHRSVQSKILRMRAPKALPPTPECIGDAEWLEVAAGLLPEAATRERMKHAAQCGHCGPLLKNAAEALVDETTPSEEAWLASLRSAGPEWRKNMAETLRDNARAGNSGREKKEGTRSWQRLFFWPRPAFALAGIAVAIIAGLLGVRMLRPRSADQLLAQAYTERRTLEVRIPGAEYAPLRVERTASGSNLDKSPFLLKAEALISENLVKNPNDPTWLQARARADFLDGNYESAIVALQRALERQPNSSSLLTDLGSAYFLQAETGDRAMDYGNAADSLSKALTYSPDDPIALFNRALVFERMFLYTQAIDDWEHYLRVDQTSAWAEDARKRLALLKDKVRAHSDAVNEPLWTLNEFPTRPLKETSSEIYRRGEEYLQQATRVWLRELFSPNGQNSQEVGIALGILANGLSHLHSDDWLTDMLASSRSKELVEGIARLDDAIELDLTGNYDASQAAARRAEGNFRAARNLPGALRSRVELIYSLDRASQGYACLQEAGDLKRQLQAHRYPWIEIQADTEIATCRLITASSNPSAEAKSAVQLAQRVGYQNLFLRAWSNAISIESVRGDIESAFQDTARALDTYWRGYFPPSRAFQLCSELAYAAEDAGILHTAIALSRESLAALTNIHNLPVEAAEHYRLASLELNVDATQEAEDNFVAANQLFDHLPKTNTTRGFRVDAQTWLASLEARRGNLDRARDLLEQARLDLALVPSITVPLRFYATRGAISMSSGEYGSADSALRAAVHIAESGARNLKTTRERILWDNEVESAYRKLVELRLRHFGDPAVALELWEEYRALPLQRPLSAASRETQSSGIDFASLDAGPPLILSDLVTATLPKLDHSTILSYEVTSDGVAVWEFDDRGINSYWVPIPEVTLKSLAHEFTLQCSTSQSDLRLLNANARRLYDLLLTPVSSFLQSSRTLLVEPDESLSGLPFDALLDKQGIPLAQNFLMTTSLGIGFLNQNRPERTLSQESSALIVGTPALRPGVSVYLPPIPDATAEAVELSHIFHNARLLLGQRATLQAVQANLPSTEIFHFAGHAISGDEQSGLLLAPPERSIKQQSGGAALLSAASLDSVSIRDLQLVVLAACSTGLTMRGSSLSPNNLVIPFLAAGVPRVVASVWNVDSATTGAMVRDFYGFLLSGDSVAVALRRAQAEIRRDPRTSHPYYWAGFRVFGKV
jgi:CHAT domain-containing protein